MTGNALRRGLGRKRPECEAVFRRRNNNNNKSCYSGEKTAPMSDVLTDG